MIHFPNIRIKKRYAAENMPLVFVGSATNGMERMCQKERCGF